MTQKSRERPCLTLSYDEARERIAQQIKLGKELPNASINENGEARKWYEYVAELLRRMCTTDELFDEFTGRNSIGIGDVDITVGHYLEKLDSIQARLDLYPQTIVQTLPAVCADPLREVDRLLAHFHAVARQLRHRHDNRSTLFINDEYDVQDLLHALLRVFFDDIRPEEWTPNYAGASSRMDFLLKAENTVVEVKKTRSGLGAKEIGEQLSVDIMRYRSHPDCKILVCFVYDPDEIIPNPRGIESDLSKPLDGLIVKVFVAQR